MSINIMKETTEGVSTKLVEESAVSEVTNYTDKLRQEIIESGEVDRLTSELTITEPATIVQFGCESANKLSSCADAILSQYNMDEIDKSSSLMITLDKLMSKIDIGEIDKVVNDKKNFIEKLVGNATKKLNQIVQKYDTVGKEMEKVCTELRVFEMDLDKANNNLSKMYEENMIYYKQLLAYVMAGEQGLKELDEYINSLDDSDTMELSKATQAKSLLEQRVDDLRKANMIALQSIPMLKSLEYGNLNLKRKIESSFVVSIPAFKSCMVQAIMAKKQSLQINAMNALDKRTNELLEKTSENIGKQMVETAKIVGKSSIDVETLEKSWKNIVDSVNETKRINQEMSEKRKDNKERLKALENEMNELMHSK